MSKSENKDNRIDLELEPIYLRIGFKHIDFVNVIMV